MSRQESPSVRVPVVVGSVSLLLAAVLGYVTVRDVAGDEQVAALAGASSPSPARVVSERGGFAVAVPSGLEVFHGGRTVRLVSGGKDLVVVVGPAGPGTLGQAERRVLVRVAREYRSVALRGTRSGELNGNRTRTVYGQAVNDAGTRLWFAVVTVHTGTRNFAVAAYAAHDADPETVLPEVTAVVSGFEVLPTGR